MEAGSTQDVANLGMMRPPLIYLVAILIGLLLDAFLPLGLIPRPLGTFLGCATIMVAVGLFIVAVRTFRSAGTPVPGNRPTTAIVCDGPYRFTRNPIYLAFSLLHLGVALCVSSLWLVMTLVGAVALMSLVVIPREERYLETRFPAEYLPYRESVRRWV